MQSPPISQSEIDARIHDHVDELLALWWAEQGGCEGMMEYLIPGADRSGVVCDPTYPARHRTGSASPRRRRSA